MAANINSIVLVALTDILEWMAREMLNIKENNLRLESDFLSEWTSFIRTH